MSKQYVTSIIRLNSKLERLGKEIETDLCATGHLTHEKKLH